jgi:hypothetical protein
MAQRQKGRDKKAKKEIKGQNRVKGNEMKIKK